MTEQYRQAKCDKCGGLIAFEDSVKTEFCECDPTCACCRKKYKGKDGKTALCPDCLNDERHGDFQSQFPELHDQIFIRRQAYENPEEIEKALEEALDSDLQRQWGAL